MTLIDPVKLEKMVLAKRIGRFLAAEQVDEERKSVEEAAKTLATDDSEAVREVLAFELRKSPTLNLDLAMTIAFDNESVAPPFLMVTRAFSDEQMAEIIPKLAEYSRVAVARRTDLGELAASALASEGEEPSVITMVRNDSLSIDIRAYENLMGRFASNTRIMDHMSGRSDLPGPIIEQLVDKVSPHNRQAVMNKTAAVAFEAGSEGRAPLDMDDIYTDVNNASPQQIHAYVTQLRGQKAISMLMVMEMAERGIHQFLESAVALEAGLPLARVREIFSLSQPSDFVRLMQMANVSKTMAPQVLGFVKKHYSAKAA